MKQPDIHSTEKKTPVFSMDYPDILKWKIIQDMQKTLHDESQTNLYQNFYHLKMLCQAVENPQEILSHFNEQEIQQLRLVDILFNTLRAKNTLENCKTNFTKELASELNMMSDILTKGYAAFVIQQDFDGSTHVWTPTEVNQFCTQQTQAILNIYECHLEAPENKISEIIWSNYHENFFDWLLSKIQELKENLFGKSTEQLKEDKENHQLFSDFRSAQNTSYQFKHTFFKPETPNTDKEISSEQLIINDVDNQDIPGCN